MLDKNKLGMVFQNFQKVCTEYKITKIIVDLEKIMYLQKIC